jgi:hypothetical protein
VFLARFLGLLVSPGKGNHHDAALPVKVVYLAGVHAHFVHAFVLVWRCVAGIFFAPPQLGQRVVVS